jgi:hypothetical protein
LTGNKSLLKNGRLLHVVISGLKAAQFESFIGLAGDPKAE